MASWNRERGLGLALLMVGLGVGCSGADFSTGNDAGAGDSAGSGGAGGSSSGGKGGGKGGKGGASGSSGTDAGGDATGGTDAAGGTDATGGSGGSTGGAGAKGGAGGTGGSTGGSGNAGSGGDAGSVSGTSGSSGMGGSTSGSSGTGTGGSGGNTPCVPGGACNTENAQCDEAGCCACSDTCTDGKWVQSACPPCAQPICPPDPPLDGDACSECGNPPQCEWDQCASDNTQYSAQCVDDKWTVVSSTCGASACCDGDDQCGGKICVNNVCKDEVDSPRCWRDDDCSNGEFCSAPFVCSCNSDCSNADYPGTCVPEGQDCCRDDMGCAASEQCVAGRCEADPSPGCWTDRDCGGGTCLNPSVCTCGTACVIADSPGVCVFDM